jgi:signal transduction histidine kinase
LTEFFDAAVIVSVRQFAADQLTRTDDDYSRLSTRRKAAQSDADNLRAVDTTRLHLLRVTAHELRNLLNSASLTADALRDETDPLARAEMQATQTRSHQQMAMLLNQLLEAAPLLSGHETPKFAPLDLAAFARQESRTLERMAAAKGLRFDCEVPPDVGEVISDVAKLRRVVTNLAQNAIKYTESGCVAFAVARPEPSRWLIRISDTGPGIPPEHQSKIFEEFHRVPGTEGAEGTGLGLAIVKYLVLLLRGEIRVESQVGQGSSFYVQFPSEVA